MSNRTSILVLRGNDEFSSILRSADMEVTNLPLIRTEPLADQSGLRRSVEKIEEYDGLFFTSPAAAEIFTTEMANGRCEYRGKIYVMGARSESVLNKAGFTTEFDPRINTAEELITSRGNEFAEKKLLFVRGDQSLLTIPGLLKGKASVDEVVVYQTVATHPSNAEISGTAKRLTAGDFEWICFFSPSAVEVFRKRFEKKILVKTAAIGRSTSQRAAELGFNVEFVSPRSSAAEFGQAFISHLNGT